jgi:hypothetical protein
MGVRQVGMGVRRRRRDGAVGGICLCLLGYFRIVRARNPGAGRGRE